MYRGSQVVHEKDCLCPYNTTTQTQRLQNQLQFNCYLTVFYTHLCLVPQFPSVFQRHLPSVLPQHSFETSNPFDVMNIVYFSNEFPKENLQDVFRQLHKESKSSNHYLLARFISEATRAVKKEIEQLPSSLKHIIPPFESLSAWSEQKELREGELCGAIDGVLLILLQISVYIW